MVYIGFWRRLVATHIDTSLLCITFSALAFSIEYLTNTTNFAWKGFFPFLLLNWIYRAGMESSSKRATIGKLAVGIAVTDTEGNPLGFGKALGRNVAKIFSSVMFGIGYLICVFTKKKQCVHDLVAGTVVSESREMSTGLLFAIGIGSILTNLVAVGLVLTITVGSAALSLGSSLGGVLGQSKLSSHTEMNNQTSVTINNTVNLSSEAPPAKPPINIQRQFHIRTIGRYTITTESEQVYRWLFQQFKQQYPANVNSIAVGPAIIEKQGDEHGTNLFVRIYPSYIGNNPSIHFCMLPSFNPTNYNSNASIELLYALSADGYNIYDNRNDIFQSPLLLVGKPPFEASGTFRVPLLSNLQNSTVVGIAGVLTVNLPQQVVTLPLDVTKDNNNKIALPDNNVVLHEVSLDPNHNGMRRFTYSFDKLPEALVIEGDAAGTEIGRASNSITMEFPMHVSTTKLTYIIGHMPLKYPFVIGKAYTPK